MAKKSIATIFNLYKKTNKIVKLKIPKSKARKLSLKPFKSKRIAFK